MLDSIGTFSSAGLDAETIESSLSHQCDIGAVKTVVEIDDGVNASAILHTTTGKYFVKFNTFSPSSNLFYAQPFILAHFNSNQPSVLTPTIIGYDYTRDDIAYPWYLTEFVDGTVFDTEDQPITVEKSRTVGRVLGQINSIEVDGVGYPEQETRTGKSCSVAPALPFLNESWEQHLKDEMYQFVNTADSRFYELQEPIHQFIESQSVREITPQLTHFDYWWENILWTPDDTPCVIDWERAVGGDPIANRILSEHYLFDTIALESEQFSEAEYASDRAEMKEAFRDAYESSYSGRESLQIDAETRTMYELLVYVREMRGFPYWWRNKPTDWTDKREAAIRDGVTQIINLE